jgi:hypothetical protein
MTLVGYWNSEAEAAKLSQYFLVPGIVEENVKIGNPVSLIPAIRAGAMGLGVQWNRSKTDPSTLASDIDVSGLAKQRVLKSGIEYDQMTTTLKACNISVSLDKFNASIWKTENDYKETEYQGCQAGLLSKLGDKIIYDNETYTTKQMAGLHEIAARNYTATAANQELDIDAGEAALSIAKWRLLRRSMLYGVDFFLVPTWLPDYIGAMLQEYGSTQFKYDTAGGMGWFSWTPNQFGQRVYTFDGIPLIPSTFMCKEQANTGMSTTSGNARAKYSSGTAQYSLFGVKKGEGDIGKASPGLRLLFGNVPNMVDFFTFEHFDKSETLVDTELMGLTTYTQHIPGSKYCVGRIFDFTMAALTA